MNPSGIQDIECPCIVPSRERYPNSDFYIFVFINLKRANIFKRLIARVYTNVLGLSED